MVQRAVIYSVLVLAVGCHRPASTHTPQQRPTGSRDVPGLLKCKEFVEMAGDSEEELKAWDAAFDACSLVLQRRAMNIMDMFHAGDCDSLSAFASEAERLEEARFVAALLDDLGDARGKDLFMRLFPLDPEDPLDRSEDLRGIDQFLAPEEGCHPASCRAPEDPACSPWFGLWAPGACAAVRYGPTDGCMPAYCFEGHEYLTLASRRDWEGARSLLLRALAGASASVWGYLCHCGLRGGIADRGAWEKLASGEKELKAIASCFADTPGNTTTSCWSVNDKSSGRVCGQESGFTRAGPRPR